METLFESLEEHAHPIQAQVTGKIPYWVEGSLYRNGPGKFDFGDTKVAHWFDGMALIHRFHINNGTVTYHSKFLRSDNYLRNKAANRVIVDGFATVAYADPCKSLFERVFSFFVPRIATDNTVVNVLPIGDSLYTATETHFLRRIDPETLDTLEKVDLKDMVSVNFATAHPHWDPDGAVYNLGGAVNRGYKYTVVKIKPEKNASNGKPAEKAEVVASIPCQWRFFPSYSHSFSISPNYFILLEQPLVINVLKIMTSKIRQKPFSEAMEWYPKEKTRFLVVDKRTGERVNPDYDYVADPFFTFHHINAYEENGQLVVDMSCFTDDKVFRLFDMENLWKSGLEEYLHGAQRPQNRRYVLPLKLDKETKGNQVRLEYTTATARIQQDNQIYCTYDVLNPSAEHGLDFPQINYRKVNGRKHRYIYGCGFIDTQVDSIIKIDTATRKDMVWKVPGHYPSEPVFVANPEGQAEDDGVLMSVVLNTGPDRKAYLLVLDARDLTELARATVDVRMGLGTHGTFLGKTYKNSTHLHD